MFKIVIEYIKYSWAKDSKKPDFNIVLYLLKIYDFIRHACNKQKSESKTSKNIFNIFILILALAFVRSCINSSQATATHPVQVKQGLSKPTAEEIAAKKKLDDVRKLIDVFVENNKELLGPITSFEKSSIEDNTYVISTAKNPYKFSISIDNNKVNYINVVYKDMINIPLTQGDEPIKKKSYDYTMKTVKDGIKEKEAFQELQDNIEKFKSQFSVWDGSNRYLVRAVKDNMNDPHSFEHVNTAYYVDSKDHSLMHVQMQFRGKNAFGALILKQIKVKMDVDGNILDYVFE